MAVNTPNYPTLRDQAGYIDNRGQTKRIAEVLHQVNGMVDDIPFFMGNRDFGMEFSVRTSIPEPQSRRFYEGAPIMKSSATMLRESVMNLEGRHVIDAKLLEREGGQEARAKDIVAVLEGFSQKFVRKVLYGNVDTDPDDIQGLAQRYSATTFRNKDYLIKGKGTEADNRSVWLVCWGEMSTYMFTPMGFPAGLQIEDLGTQEIPTDNANAPTKMYTAAIMKFYWDFGLAMEDYRYTARYCNIDVSNLTTDASGDSENLPDQLGTMLGRVPENFASIAYPVLYMSKDVMEKLRPQISRQVRESTLQWEEVGASRLYTFQGIPIRQVDQMKTDEALVV